jgi:ubiquinone biosynthesis protein COQ4
MLALKAALAAFRDPRRQDMIAILGETTGRYALERMRDRMLLDSGGRRVLQTRPLINSTTINLDSKSWPKNSLGYEYTNFLAAHSISPDTRAPVKYINDNELAYVMTRYRQIHDFWHVLLGLPITVQSEIALKWFECFQTGLPMTLISAILGPLKLSKSEREELLDMYLPWMVKCASQAPFLMCVMYEDMLNTDIDSVRSSLFLYKFPC